MAAASILITGDDAAQRRLLEAMVQKCGLETVVVEPGDVMAALASPRVPAVGAVVLDLGAHGSDVLAADVLTDALTAMGEAGLPVPVIVQTGGLDQVAAAMAAGAHDFVVKPAGLERLKTCLRNALNSFALKRELQRLRHSREGRLTFSHIVTRSEAMAAAIRTAQKAASSTGPVLIEGESGVGKELFARAIHGSGERKARPFVAVDCRAIAGNLADAVLFGHEKGAFAGMRESPAGKIVEAHGGTLFLDEVGDLPASAQTRLLRVLQDGTLEAAGGHAPVRVDVRIMSATSRGLRERVTRGEFREDLFYRLGALPLTLPPLRARRDDIPHLVRHFLAQLAAEENRAITGIADETLALLSQLNWPGNVRQLKSTVYRAVMRSDGEELGSADFPVINAQAPVVPEAPGDPLAGSSAPPARISGSEIPIAPLLTHGALAMLTASGEVRPLAEMENEIIRFAIAHYRGQMSEIARRLKIGRSTLYRRLDDVNAQQASDGAA